MKKGFSKIVHFVIATILCVFTVGAFSIPTSAYYGYEDLGHESSSQILDYINGYNLYEILDSIIELAGPAGKIVFIIAFAFSTVVCLFGYNLYKFFMGLFGFGLGALIGLVLYIYNQESIWLLIGLVLAIVCAVIAYKVHQIGLFINGFFNAFILSFVLQFIIVQNVESSMIIVSIIIAIISGIVVVKLEKSSIIIYTAVSCGFMSGIWLSCIISNTGLMAILSIVCAVVGIAVQCHINGGLLNSGSLIEKIKGKKQQV